MTWAYFQNQAAWDTYSNAACADRGIPKPGRIQATAAPAILNQWTDAWCDPIQVKGTGNVTAWVAHVPDADVVTYNLGLNVPDSAVTWDANGMVTFTYQGRTYTGQADVGFNWRKPKPATYTMTDEHGVSHVYDTATGAIVG